MTTMMDLYQEWARAKDWANATRYRNDQFWRRYCWLLHNVDVLKLNEGHIESLYYQLQVERRLSRGTIQTASKIVSALCEYGVKRHYLEDNPCQRAEHPRWDAPGANIVAPTPDEVERLLTAAEEWCGIAPYAFIVVSASLGTRRSETCALRWGNINLREQEITIEAALDTAPDHALELKATKTYATATLSIGDKAAHVLARLYASRCGECERLAIPYPSAQSFVFKSDPRGDKPWSPQRATNEFAKARSAAALGPHVTLKSLRHFHATQLISHGVDIRTVAGRLRHANPGTTLTYYAKFDKRADRAAADMFDAL